MIENPAHFRTIVFVVNGERLVTMVNDNSDVIQASTVIEDAQGGAHTTRVIRLERQTDNNFKVVQMSRMKHKANDNHGVLAESSVQLAAIYGVHRVQIEE